MRLLLLDLGSGKGGRRLTHVLQLPWRPIGAVEDERLAARSSLGWHPGLLMLRVRSLASARVLRNPTHGAGCSEGKFRTRTK